MPTLSAAEADEQGLCTYLLDPVDWDDDVRIALEERVSLSPDALTGMEASLRFGGAENCDSKIFGRLSAWQNWIFTRPNATGDEGALTRYGAPESAKFDWRRTVITMSTVDLEAKIPNNVGLRENKRLMMALEKWQPKFLEWWGALGPSDFNQDQIYLRTAIGVGQGGWAHFDYVKMPDYRWGIFLADGPAIARSTSATTSARSRWQEVPGEFRNRLRRLIVTQGDTEPASVEQQRKLGHCCPSLYDLRSLFQVNVEEGRHLWAMVYLLQTHFGADGRDEAEAMLERHSGDKDNPRILQAFNYPVTNWLDFFCFTAFMDRDGKYQLASLAESSFDPLARSTQFMLAEEAYHLQTGENGVGRIVKRTGELMQAGQRPAQGRRDPARHHPEVHQLLVHGFDGPVRWRGQHQRRRGVRDGPEGPLPRERRHLQGPEGAAGQLLARGPDRGRQDREARHPAAPRDERRAARRLHRRLQAHRRTLEPRPREGRREGPRLPAGPQVQPAPGHLRRLPLLAAGRADRRGDLDAQAHRLAADPAGSRLRRLLHGQGHRRPASSPTTSRRRSRA
jgi:hypothetical protein